MKEIKKPKKPLIFYYGIVMAALLLVNLFIMPWLARTGIAGLCRGVEKVVYIED